MNGTFQIASKRVGPGCPCFFIAEAGVNHNGSKDQALQLVDAACEAGADAVKFQTFITSKVMTSSAPQAKYQVTNTGKTESQLEMVQKLELSFDDFRLIKTYCDEKKILFLSTPFDYESLDFLSELGVEAFKIGSGDITHLPFLKRIASTKKPVILSTGMSFLSEVDSAVRLLREEGCTSLSLLHCVSSYPAPAEECNLRCMASMREAFQIPVGFSDHTLGPDVPLAAAALGACVIEKHFTLDRSLPGPDHLASAEPEELKELISSIRAVESAMGDGLKRPTPAEFDTAQVARRSIVASRDIGAGEKLTEEMLDVKRPGKGLPPSTFPLLLGRKTRENIKADTQIDLSMLE